MIKKQFYILLLLLLVVVSCERGDEYAEGKEPTNPTEDASFEGAYVDDMIVIRVTEELAAKIEASKNSGFRATNAFSADHAMDQAGIMDAERSFRNAGKFESRTRAEGMHLWYSVTLDTSTSTRSASKASAVMAEIEGVVKVIRVPKFENFGRIVNVPKFNAPNYAPRAAMIEGKEISPFNDPMLKDQWHYYNDGSIDSSVAGCDINVMSVWRDYTSGKPEVIVCIVDEGIDYRHVDLKDNMWRNEAEINGTPGVDDDNNGHIDDFYGYNFYNDLGSIAIGSHGTHVGGTVSAVNNNGIGVSGIAGGDGTTPGVRLISAQIFSPNGSIGRAWEGIKYGADNGAVISQNSWGSNSPNLENFELIKDAIAYFIKYAGCDEYENQVGPMKGGLVLFATGNSGLNVGYPAKEDNVMAVTSLRYNYMIASYSNYGTWVNITAPGGLLYDANGAGGVLSTSPYDTYQPNNGTSMACPHVAGIAALVISVHGGAGYTAQMLWDRLIDSARDIDSYNNVAYKGQIGPLVDAARAVAGLSTIAPGPITDFTFDGLVSNRLDFSWSIPADADDVQAPLFNLYYSKTSLAGLDVMNIPSNVSIQTIRSGGLKAGQKLSTTVKGLDFDQQYYFRIASYDFADNFSALSTEIAQKSDPNKPPSIVSHDGVSFVVKSHEKQNITITITEPEDDKYTWSVKPGSFAFTHTQNDGVITAIIDGTRIVPGPTLYTATISAEDQYGAASSLSITYKITANNPPTVIKPIGDMKFSKTGETKTLDMSEYFKDDDNDVLRYTFSSDKPSLTTQSITGNILTITSNNLGTANATITATDPTSASITSSFKIEVSTGITPPPGDESGVSIYPARVTDNLNIKTDVAISGNATIYNGSGSKVYNKDFHATPTTDAVLNLKFLTGGVHTLVLTFGGTEVKRNFVKL